MMAKKKAFYTRDTKKDFSVNNKQQFPKGTEAPHMP